MTRIHNCGEFGLIDALTKVLPLSKEVVRGAGDDTAVLKFTADRYLLLTTDMLAQGVHFQKNAAPEMIGHKALACNISDIAAMGGIPKHAVISISVPKGYSPDFVKRLYNGIRSLARRFEVNIVGGDTIRASQLVINVALTGEVRRKDLVLRKGACQGDWIFTTGALGRAWKTDRHLTFTPRVDEARFLVKNFKPSAMIDISDGLVADLGHILEQSHVGARLFEDEIPLNSGAKLDNALYDGEDFELVFTLRPDKAKALIAWQEKNSRWFFYPIGEVTRKKGISLITRDNKQKKVVIKGFTHF